MRSLLQSSERRNCRSRKSWSTRKMKESWSISWRIKMHEEMKKKEELELLKKSWGNKRG